ncbi:MAG TPA: helix-turn-helix transcriptional regulator [Hyphomicrobiaceae bacterium]
MTVAALESRTLASQSAIAGRRDLSAFMRQLCARTGADAYVLLDATPGVGPYDPPILASNWTYDAIQSTGVDTIRHIGESSVSVYVGTEPHGWHPLALAVLLGREEIANLVEFGHEEIVALRLHIAGKRYHLLLSSARTGALDCTAIFIEHMRCGYALAQFAGLISPDGDSPLSERERECLSWVSQGKTTEEIAVILDVSSNTINSYIAHAIHKLAASNRAMAVASAIRRNLI